MAATIDYISDQANIKECRLCEQADLGFTIDALLRVERAPRAEEAVAAAPMLLAA